MSQPARVRGGEGALGPTHDAPAPPLELGAGLAESRDDLAARHAPAPPPRGSGCRRSRGVGGSASSVFRCVAIVVSLAKEAVASNYHRNQLDRDEVACLNDARLVSRRRMQRTWLGVRSARRSATPASSPQARAPQGSDSASWGKQITVVRPTAMTVPAKNRIRVPKDDRQAETRPGTPSRRRGRRRHAGSHGPSPKDARIGRPCGPQS